MTVAPVPPVPRSTGVTVWDRKKPERHPEKEVKAAQRSVDAGR